MRIAAPLAVLVGSLLAAAPALARSNGEGVIGETDDRIITFFSLGVVVFFFLVALLGTVLQNLLERRKQERHALELRRRIGW